MARRWCGPHAITCIPELSALRRVSSNTSGSSSSMGWTPGHVVSVPWPSSLPPVQDAPQFYRALGESLVTRSATYDTGPRSFAEVFTCRRQLEIVARSLGYDMSVYAFGGVAVSGILETGGDVDFVGLMDFEPNPQEASDIVARIAKDMRRMGLRARAVSKARVPVVKAERASRVSPGTPTHALACTGVLQFAQPLLKEESETFGHLLQSSPFNATEVEWNPTLHSVTVCFRTSMELMAALSHFRSYKSIEIPLRAPVDPRQGPELYRFPFDFCLSSTGLRNTTLLAEHLAQYKYSRALLLALKRWGRASGVINTLDGLLASYALTILVSHFLAQIGVLPFVDPNRLSHDLKTLPKELEYRPLESACDTVPSAQQLGFLLAAFFEYYSEVFPFDREVVCTTRPNVAKSVLNWDVSPAEDVGRPPFFHLSLKDPYGLDNVARNVDAQGTRYIIDCFKVAHACIRDVASMPVSSATGELLVETITRDPPRPSDAAPTPLFLRTQSPDSASSLDKGTSKESGDRGVVYELRKREFHNRRAAVDRFGSGVAQSAKRNKAAVQVASSVGSWLRSDSE